MRSEDVRHVLALESFLDKHDTLLLASKALYQLYCGDRIEDLPFQRDLVAGALAANRTWTAEIATGLGKSVIAARIAAARMTDGPVIYVCPNRTAIGDHHVGIANKFVRTFETFGRRATVGAVNDLSRANDVSFVTPYSLIHQLQHDRRRVLDLLHRSSCFVIDEAHHFPGDEQNDLRIYGAIYDVAESHVRDGLTIAMTGTWERLDGMRVMGRDRPDVTVTVQDAVDLGRCPEIYGVQVITDVVAKGAKACGDLYDLHLSPSERRKYLNGVAECMLATRRRYPVPFATFVRTRDDAKVVAEAFNAKLKRGERRLGVLLGTTSVRERHAIIRAITDGQLAGYVTCAVGEEALDLPALEVVHLVRRTRSYIRNMQAIGRALRVCEGKRRALVIDYQTALDSAAQHFVGLTLDDLAVRQGTRIERRINGGPMTAQRTFDQAVLAGMTVGDERAICLRTPANDSNSSKNLLLEMAEAGQRRPRSANSRNKNVPRDEALLARQLYNYVTEGRGVSFDPTFTAKLRAIRPDWLAAVHNPNQKKQALLQRAQNGGPKPTRSSKIRDERLMAQGLFNYSYAHSPVYDPEFIERLRAIRPDWFERQRPKTDELKEELRRLAKSGAPRPGNDTRIGKALTNYADRQSAPTYDAVFAKKIRKLRPNWFSDEMERIEKQELLYWARSRVAKPQFTATTKIERSCATALSKYTCQHRLYGSYDPEFTEQLRAIRPEWLGRNQS